MTIFPMEHADDVLKEALALSLEHKEAFLSDVQSFLPPIFEKDGDVKNKPVH